jgi:hypothetical protein
LEEIEVEKSCAADEGGGWWRWRKARIGDGWMDVVEKAGQGLLYVCSPSFASPPQLD